MKNKNGYSKQDLKLIRNFIHEINSELKLRIATDRFFICVIPQYKIYLGAKKQPIEEDNIWWEWFSKQEFFTEDINKRIISILHEVGHFQTFDVNEWLDRNEKHEKLIDDYYDYKLDMKELNFAYWDLTNEYKATKWAIEYYVNNRVKCEQLAKAIRV